MAKEFNLDEFIKKHNERYINYCEAIILSDGSIEYALPSHNIKLRELWGCPYHADFDVVLEEDKKFLNAVPEEASPGDWLCEDLRCISVWHNYSVIPISYTEESLNAYLALVKNNCVSRNTDIKISAEKTWVETLRKGDFDKLKRIRDKCKWVEMSIHKMIQNT